MALGYNNISIDGIITELGIPNPNTIADRSTDYIFLNERVMAGGLYPTFCTSIADLQTFPHETDKFKLYEQKTMEITLYHNNPNADFELYIKTIPIGGQIYTVGGAYSGSAAAPLYVKYVNVGNDRGIYTSYITIYYGYGVALDNLWYYVYIKNNALTYNFFDSQARVKFVAREYYTETIFPPIGNNNYWLVRGLHFINDEYRGALVQNTLVSSLPY